MSQSLQVTMLLFLLFSNRLNLAPKLAGNSVHLQPFFANSLISASSLHKVVIKSSSYSSRMSGQCLVVGHTATDKL